MFDFIFCLQSKGDVVAPVAYEPEGKQGFLGNVDSLFGALQTQ